MDQLIVLGIILILAIMVIRTIVHVVPEYQRLVVLAFGRYQGTKGPGLVLLFPPPIQSAMTVDLREFMMEIPQQTSITKDNAPISIDFLIYQKVVEAADSVLKIQNFRTAVQGIATTTLRAVIGDIPLDDVLAKREQINEVLRVKLDDITQRWGVKVTTVEIREITPPRDIQDAMNRQMSAERNRRAAILEAEGFGLALDKINEAAGHADVRTMTLQYLDTLRQIGASPATKFVIPTEFTSLLSPLIGMTRGSGESGGKG